MMTRFKLENALVLIFILLINIDFVFSKDGLKTPDIQLKDISLIKLDFEKAQFLIDLRVHNTNKVDIVVESMRYKLTVNDAQVNQGLIKQMERFKAQTTRSVSVPVTVAYDQNLAKILNALSSSAAPDYEIAGSVKLKGYQQPLPFQHKDKLTLCPTC